jgi:hypothetical protein
VTDSSDRRLFFRLETQAHSWEWICPSNQNGSRIALRELRPLLEYLFPPIFYLNAPRAPVRRVAGCALDEKNGDGGGTNEKARR